MPEAVVAGFDDVAAVGEPVEQRRGHLGFTEDSGSLGEAEVGGNDQTGLLVEFADQVEEQGPADLRERQPRSFLEPHSLR